MHALIVVANPNPGSLSHSLAAEVAEGVAQAGPGDTFEIADLAAESFDPRFNADDIAAHLRERPAPADVLAEQARIDRADALVLVYPVYWWSMPGLLKGWIDRVFSNGWAYDDLPGSPTIKKLTDLRVHLIAVGGANLRTYARHGYFGAMRTQIDHGIFGYCGAPVMSSELLLTETQDMTSNLHTARAIGQNLFAFSLPEKAADAA
ncbi:MULTISPECIES: NAD(P)H-dependent oxidoreductase [unclassified Rhizobium]|jgi:NAD(P)H dehydrogenase (quinone)|uniref:NAD(P)H-dependent oxidoreductase n=1 Tax=unclassified Rhizobium TaxID=2613769 RepID=UPI0006482D9B|nr:MULTISPECIES: NAD(P)H-dependent oxidoreductase [unclassified Rhizobium]MBN8954703.1 NAD(P)H-dependent oxidoreductase [Rhizobium tropici]OJY75481.1 MAG: NAD(P)H dehydrogenase [Rhizobium sp. 60-20]RKD70497.1 NAD(P)H dehydrogenase (quinone) [Rhizobium sp. WW_1]